MDSMTRSSSSSTSSRAKTTTRSLRPVNSRPLKKATQNLIPLSLLHESQHTHVASSLHGPDDLTLQAPFTSEECPQTPAMPALPIPPPSDASVADHISFGHDVLHRLEKAYNSIIDLHRKSRHAFQAYTADTAALNQQKAKHEREIKSLTRHRDCYLEERNSAKSMVRKYMAEIAELRGEAPGKNPFNPSFLVYSTAQSTSHGSFEFSDGEDTPCQPFPLGRGEILYPPVPPNITPRSSDRDTDPSSSTTSGGSGSQLPTLSSPSRVLGSFERTDSASARYTSFAGLAPKASRCSRQRHAPYTHVRRASTSSIPTDNGADFGLLPEAVTSTLRNSDTRPRRTARGRAVSEPGDLQSAASLGQSFDVKAPSEKVKRPLTIPPLPESLSGRGLEFATVDIRQRGDSTAFEVSAQYIPNGGGGIIGPTPSLCFVLDNTGCEGISDVREVSPVEEAIDIMDINLLYTPAVGKLWCRPCLLQNLDRISTVFDPATVRETLSLPSDLEATAAFTTSASWDDLRMHSLGMHGIECSKLVELTDAEMSLLRRSSVQVS